MFSNYFTMVNLEHNSKFSKIRNKLSEYNFACKRNPNIVIIFYSRRQLGTTNPGNTAAEGRILYQ